MDSDKHGAYGLFVHYNEEFEYVEIANESVSEKVSFIVVHDNTKNGLKPSERATVALQTVLRPVYWNDIDSYYWMHDFKVGNYWCRMIGDYDSVPYYVAHHITVEE